MKNTGPSYNNDKGAMLIVLIVSLTMIGVLGTSALYTSTSSKQTGLFSNAYSRAYYLAESGVRYAKLNLNNSINFPASTQFNFTNGDSFVIRTMDDPLDSSRIIIYATGFINSGSWFESKCALTSNLPKPGGSGDGQTDVGFIVPGGKGKGSKGKGSLDPRWNVTGGSKTSNIVKIKKNQGDVIALTTQTEKGKSKGKGKGKGSAIEYFKAILLSLGWWKVDPENPDMDEAWSQNNELLSYEAQVKVKVKIKAKKSLGDHFMHGISFRLSPKNPDWENSSSIRSYGISYFRSVDYDWPFNVRLDSSFNKIMNDSNPYIVLWEKSDAGNALVLKDYKKLAAGDGVLDGSKLKDWATIVLKLEEKFTGPVGTRENHISGFIQGPDSIPLGTIDWDYDNYNVVLWNTNNPQPILDYSLISTTFGTNKPDEIGIHAFYDSNEANKQFFSDFSLKIGGTTDQSSPYQW